MSPLRAPAVSVVMGIPSVRREVHSYLTDTLHSLISELSPQEKEDSVIVVLIAEASGPGPGEYKNKKQTERHGEYTSILTEDAEEALNLQQGNEIAVY